MFVKTVYRPVEEFSIPDFPDVVFVELEQGGDLEISFVVKGGNGRHERNQAARRFNAAMIEYGCRQGDLRFCDIDDAKILPAS